MALKDYILSDLDMLYNLNELAELHNIDGRNMTVIPCNELIQKLKVDMGEGVYKGLTAFRVRISEFGERPPIGKKIMYDNKPKKVFDCQDEEGEYVITLEAIRS